MKKFVIVALVGMLAVVLVLAGCAGQGSSSSSEAGSSSLATSATNDSGGTEGQESAIVGGWTVYDGTTSAINDDVRASWDKAMEGYTGVGYEPVRVIATQVVSGTNYAILARGTTVTANPTTDWYVVKMYVDLNGNASIASSQKIDLANIKVAQKADDESATSGEIVGGWEIPNPANSILEPEDAQKAFNKAYESYKGAELYPIATLGTQVVAGINYRVLCTGVPATDNPKNELYVATVYADPQGNAQITDAVALDLLGYLE